MPKMTIVRLPTEEELDAQGIDHETFMEEFRAKSGGSLTAKVTDRGDRVRVAGYEIRKADWFVLTPE